MTTKGKLIVIEGTDGSGKATQAKLLIERLESAGTKVKKLALPQYGKKSAGPSQEYLAGKYGRPPEVDPYIASVLFSVDHFDAAREIRRHLDQGTMVIMDRYVDSNAGHQGGKIKDEENRAEFLKWLYDFEYGTLGIPKPDIVIILHVPAEMSQELARGRATAAGKTLDSHEADLEHLKSAESSYLWLARNFSTDHELIACLAKGQLLPPDEVHQLVWKKLAPLLGGKI
jgi:dTMP kinase